MTRDGTQQTESQQFGSWIRVAPFTSTRKNVVIVPGFYSKKTKASSSTTSPNPIKRPSLVVVCTRGPPPEIIRLEKETEVTLQLTINIPKFQEENMGLSNPRIAGQPNLSNLYFTNPNSMEGKISNELFEASIQEQTVIYASLIRSGNLFWIQIRTLTKKIFQILLQLMRDLPQQKSTHVQFTPTPQPVCPCHHYQTYPITLRYMKEARNGLL